METFATMLFATAATPTAAGATAVTLDAELLELMLRAGSRWVLWLLLGLSLIAVAVMIERLYFYIWHRRPERALERALAAIRERGYVAAVAELEGSRSMAVTVARVCMLHADDGAASIEEHAEATVQAERLRYERGLAFLGTLGSNAPFIGLFGTVLGIVRAFHDLSLNTAAGSQAVMAGIAEALVATAVGLLVALPAVASFNFYSRHVERCVVAAEGVSHAVLAWVKRQPSATAQTPGAAGADAGGRETS